MATEHSVNKDWRSAPFRQLMVSKLDKAIQNAAVPLTLNGDARSVEDHIYHRSHSYETYVTFVGKVLHAAKFGVGKHIRPSKQPQLNLSKLLLTKQDVIAILNTLTPEQKHQLKKMSSEERRQFFYRYKQTRMAHSRVLQSRL